MIPESKLRPPVPGRGTVMRTALVDRLLDARRASLISIVAPPGYGKTTLAVQWAGRKGPRVAWVSIDWDDNDPVVLLTSIAVALDQIEPLDPGIFHLLLTSGATGTATAVCLLASALEAMPDPFALVLDNAGLLSNPDSLDA